MKIFSKQRGTGKKLMTIQERSEKSVQNFYKNKAVRNGYTKGVKVFCLLTKRYLIIKSNSYDYILNRDELWTGDILIMQKGRWAEMKCHCVHGNPALCNKFKL